MSAIVENGDKIEPIRVLFTLHEGFDTLDFVGPQEVLNHAQHNIKDASTKAFTISTCAASPAVKSAQGITIKADMDWDDAHGILDEIDVLVIPGGSSDNVLKAKAEPLGLIKAFAALQTKDPSRERTLFSVCTGSLFLAQQGILQGLAATTHPDYYTRLEILCSEAARRDTGARTDVMEERYVVNNARFDLGEKLEENPFILDKRPDGHTKTKPRRGSDAWKLQRRRESLVRRGVLPLGGLRVITSGGITAGMDAALYLVAALVSFESALEVARMMQFVWNKGVTVEGIDV